MKKSPVKIAIVWGLASVILAACGQRGPLTLPQPPEPLPKPTGYQTSPGN